MKTVLLSKNIHSFLRITRAKALAAPFLLSAAAANHSTAATYIWNGSTDSVLSTGTNWTPARSPNATTDVLIWPAGNWTVKMNTGNLTGTTGELRFQAGANVILTPKDGLNTYTATTVAVDAGATISIMSGLTLACHTTASSIFTNNGTIKGPGLILIQQAYSGTGGTASPYPAFNNTVALTLPAALTFSTVTAAGNLMTGGYMLTVQDTLMINSSRTLTNSGKVFANHVLGSGSFVNSAGALLDVTGVLTVTTLTTNMTDTVRYASTTANRTVKATTYGRLIFANTGQTCTLAGATTVNSHIGINTGATLDVSAGNYALTVGGNWTNSGTFVPQSGTVTFNGAAASLTGATVFNNVTMNKTGGANLTLNNDITVNKTLTFTLGKISTGANKVVIGSAGNAIAGAGGTTGWVIGNLEKTIDAAATGNYAYIFTTGDATRYTPVNATLNGVSMSANGAWRWSTTAGDHAGIANSTINSSKSANRTWSCTGLTNATFTSMSGVFTFDATDVDGGASATAFIVGQTADGGTTWTYPAVGVKTATSTEFMNVTNAVSDYQLGESLSTFISSPSGSYSDKLQVSYFYSTPERILYQLNGSANKDLKAEVLDILGKTIYSARISREQNGKPLTLELPNLPEGIYIFKVSGGGQTAVKKFYY